MTHRVYSTEWLLPMLRAIIGLRFLKRTSG
jgi:hypothetical protein